MGLSILAKKFLLGGYGSLPVGVNFLVFSPDLGLFFLPCTRPDRLLILRDEIKNREVHGGCLQEYVGDRRKRSRQVPRLSQRKDDRAACRLENWVVRGGIACVKSLKRSFRFFPKFAKDQFRADSNPPFPEDFLQGLP